MPNSNPNPATEARRYEVTYTIEVRDHYPQYREDMEELDLVAEAMETATRTHGRFDLGEEFTFGADTWKATARKLPGQAVTRAD